MSKMEDLRTALAGTLQSLDGLQKNAYMLANPTPPYAEVQPAPIDYDLAMQRGLDDWMFCVRVVTSLTLDIASQRVLDAYIDPTGPMSVKTLIEADRTLGGVCDSLHVTKCSGYQSYQSRHTGEALLAVEWTVAVNVSN